MKSQAALAAIAALTLTVAAGIAPAFAARSSYVIDDAHLLSQTAIAQINQQVGDFNAQTGKEVLVVTVDSLNGSDPNAAVERSFAQQQVNGVEIFIAKSEKQIKIAGDRASQQFFPSGSFNTVYQAMRPSFAQGNFDQGVETGVSLVLNTYRGHTSSLNRARHPVGVAAPAPVPVRTSNSGGSGLGFIWWIIILAVIFFIIRGIFRAMSGPRNYGGGGPGYGPGYGGPGYGGGYGGGGGGSFWSGMLGGLGGAFLGNELFGNRGGGNIGGGGEAGGSYASTGDAGTNADAGGWQSDAGQIDTSNTGGGGWGDSGGGDSGGGWGGGDSGGGGGDSGGGW